jgi:hypothetical protein
MAIIQCLLTTRSARSLSACCGVQEAFAHHDVRAGLAGMELTAWFDGRCRRATLNLPFQLSAPFPPAFLSSSTSSFSFILQYTHTFTINMLRNGATRLARSIVAPAARPVSYTQCATPTQQWTTQFGSLASKRPLPSQLARIRAMQAGSMRRNISKEQLKVEDKYAHEKLKATPETVSMTSSIHPISGEIGTPSPSKDKDADMVAGVKSDVVSRCVFLPRTHG